MANVRAATPADVPAILALGVLMHAEAPALRHAPFDRQKVGQAVEASVAQGMAFVHEHDGQIDGLFVGLLVERWFSRVLMATDMAVYVLPDRRGGLAGYRLVRRFIERCRELGIPSCDVQIGITTGVSPLQTGEFYEHMGFQRIGGNYQLKEYQHVHGS